MQTVNANSEVQSGLEGVVAFATEIAEPDRDGGALRYRGVDIEELVGSVPYERVWGLLVDGTLRAGPRVRGARRAAAADRQRARGPADVARRPRPRLAARGDHRHRRGAGSRRPRARLGGSALVRRTVGARRGADGGGGERARLSDRRRRALPHRVAGRRGPRARARRRRLLDLRCRARHERLDLHRSRRRLDRRRRRGRAVRRRRSAVGPAARRRAGARPEDARRGRGAGRREEVGRSTRSTAASA